jgi:hypothetical protein
MEAADEVVSGRLRNLGPYTRKPMVAISASLLRDYGQTVLSLLMMCLVVAVCRFR